MARLQSIPTARRSLAAAVVHKTLYDAIGGSNGTRALDTVEDHDLEVAEIASCGGEMLNICGRRDLFCLRRDGTCRGTRSAVTVEGDRAVSMRLCRSRPQQSVNVALSFAKEALPLCFRQIYCSVARNDGFQWLFCFFANVTHVQRFRSANDVAKSFGSTTHRARQIESYVFDMVLGFWIPPLFWEGVKPLATSQS